MGREAPLFPENRIRNNKGGALIFTLGGCQLLSHRVSMHPATPGNDHNVSTGLLENSLAAQKQPPELLRKVHRRRLPWRDPGVILVLRAEGDLGPIGIAIRQAIRFVARSSSPAT